MQHRWLEAVRSGTAMLRRLPGCSGVVASQLLALQPGSKPPQWHPPPRPCALRALLATRAHGGVPAGVGRASAASGTHPSPRRPVRAPPAQALPGHKDAVTCLAFREGTHELYSGSLDRSIKLWSLDDMAYVDTLFGHQAGAPLPLRPALPCSAAARAGRRARRGNHGWACTPLHSPLLSLAPPPLGCRGAGRGCAAGGARHQLRRRPHLPRVEDPGGEPADLQARPTAQSNSLGWRSRLWASRGALLEGPALVGAWAGRARSAFLALPATCPMHVAPEPAQSLAVHTVVFILGAQEQVPLQPSPRCSWDFSSARPPGLGPPTPSPTLSPPNAHPRLQGPLPDNRVLPLHHRQRVADRQRRRQRLPVELDQEEAGVHDAVRGGCSRCRGGVGVGVRALVFAMRCEGGCSASKEGQQRIPFLP